MKPLLMSICSLMYFVSFGQGASENMKQIAFSNPFHSSNQQYLSISKYENRTLDEFFKYDWTKAEVLGVNNEYVSLDSANYFYPEQKIVFYEEGAMLELYPDQIQKVRIGEDEYAPFLDKKDKNQNLKFFEILAGSEFMVLKLTVLSEEASGIHPMGIKTFETSLVKRNKYYYVSENTRTAVPVSGSKRKFLKAFKKHKRKMIAFLEKRKLSQKVENDLIMIARYYNMLLLES